MLILDGQYYCGVPNGVGSGRSETQGEAVVVRIVGAVVHLVRRDNRFAARNCRHRHVLALGHRRLVDPQFPVSAGFEECVPGTPILCDEICVQFGKLRRHSVGAWCQRTGVVVGD